MLKIGDFARLAGVTVRALRHYEEHGLLAPARVDSRTRYRSYAYRQLGALDRILALRELGFSLAQTRALLESCADVRAVAARVAEQRARVAAEVARQTARLRRLEALQDAIESRGEAELGVRFRPIPDLRALTLRARVPSLGAPVTALFEEAEARAAGARVDQSPFLLFHGERDVEACIPVRPGSDARAVRKIEGAPLASSLTYAGGYSRTQSLLPRMLGLVEEIGLHRAGPPREVYHRFGADQRGYRLPARRLAGSADEFVTELQIPVAQEDAECSS